MALPTISALGMVTSAPRPVRSRVLKRVIAATVPSCSPMRTYSPVRRVREYIRIRPLAPWPTTLEAPSDTIRPISTDMPLKASV